MFFSWNVDLFRFLINEGQQEGLDVVFENLVTKSFLFLNLERNLFQNICGLYFGSTDTFLKMEIVYQVFLAMLFLVGFSNTLALSCGPCDLSQCPELNCPGGIVDSPCQCCQICAKQLGEVCGGIWDLEGTCDEGLYCGISPDFGGSVIGGSVGTCLGKILIIS